MITESTPLPMTWWTSIVFYLWRNSVRRWIEQPLGVLSKLVVAALIGGLGSVMMLGMSYLGSQINAQLASRDAMMVTLREHVREGRAVIPGMAKDWEAQGWRSLSDDCLILYQMQAVASVGNKKMVPFYSAANPEAIGLPDTLVLVSDRYPEGLLTEVSLGEARAMALVMRPRNELLRQLAGEDDLVLGSARRLAPLLRRGYVKQVMMRAKSVAAIEKVQDIVNVMKVQDGRRVQMWSSLPLLIQLREIQVMQRNIAIAVTVGAALTLGLIFGALAWMEFREERYLLSLIRSFGVGRFMLLSHAVLENCIVAAVGMASGLGLLGLLAGLLNKGPVNLSWVDPGQLFSGGIFGIMLMGALFGGLLSCIPVGIGLRKPLGLTLK